MKRRTRKCTSQSYPSHLLVSQHRVWGWHTLTQGQLSGSGAGSAKRCLLSATIADECVLRATVLNETTSGEFKAKVRDLQPLISYGP